MDGPVVIAICVLLSKRITYLETRITHLEDAGVIPERTVRWMLKVSYY